MGRETALDRGRPITSPRKLLIAGGGTAGHVIPALVVAREFCRRADGRQALFAGTARGVETRLVPAAGFPLELLQIGALQGQSLAARAKTLLALPRAVWHALRILKKFQPDVVLGVGGYAAGPMMLAAAIRRVPLAIFEPNAYPGLANRWAAPLVVRAYLAFRAAERFFGAGKSLLTGIPVREEFFSIPPKAHQPPFTVLIFGGSQGARSLNRAVVEALPLLAHAKTPLRLLHQSGQSEYNQVREETAKFAGRGALVTLRVEAYLERMWEAFAQADLIVCRAGANTVAELAAAGRAAVLVPFPAAANQHQLRNAEALAGLGAARLVLDSDLNGERLFEVIQELLKEPPRLEQMESAIRREAHPDATQRIVDDLERLARQDAAG